MSARPSKPIDLNALYSTRNLERPRKDSDSPRLDSSLSTHADFAWHHIYQHPFPPAYDVIAGGYKESERDIHSILHVTQAALWAQYLFYLRKRRAASDDPVTSMDDEDLALLQIAMLYHDAARLNDGDDEWDCDSAAMCFDYLVHILAVDVKRATLIAEAIANKDFYNPTASDSDSGSDSRPYFKYQYKPDSPHTLILTIKDSPTANRYLGIIHDADCLEIMRCTKDFDRRYLYLVQETEGSDGEAGDLERDWPEASRLIDEAHSMIEKQRSKNSLTNHLNADACYAKLIALHDTQPWLAAMSDPTGKMPLPLRDSPTDPIAMDFLSDNNKGTLLFRGIASTNPKAPQFTTAFLSGKGYDNEITHLHSEGGNTHRSTSPFYWRTSTYSATGLLMKSLPEHITHIAYYDYNSGEDGVRYTPNAAQTAPDLPALRKALRKGRPKNARMFFSNDFAQPEVIANLQPASVLALAANLDSTPMQHGVYPPRLIFWLMCFQRDIIKSGMAPLPCYLFSAARHLCNPIHIDTIKLTKQFSKLSRQLFYQLLVNNNELALLNASDDQLLLAAVLGHPFKHIQYIDTTQYSFPGLYLTESEKSACLAIIKKHRTISYRIFINRLIKTLLSAGDSEEDTLYLFSKLNHLSNATAIPEQLMEKINVHYRALIAEEYLGLNTLYKLHELGWYYFTLPPLDSFRPKKYQQIELDLKNGVPLCMQLHHFYSNQGDHKKSEKIKEAAWTSIKTLTNLKEPPYDISSSHSLTGLYVLFAWFDAAESEWTSYYALVKRMLAEDEIYDIKRFSFGMKNDPQVVAIIEEYKRTIIQRSIEENWLQSPHGSAGKLDKISQICSTLSTSTIDANTYCQLLNGILTSEKLTQHHKKIFEAMSKLYLKILRSASTKQVLALFNNINTNFFNMLFSGHTEQTLLNSTAHFVLDTWALYKKEAVSHPTLEAELNIILVRVIDSMIYHSDWPLEDIEAFIQHGIESDFFPANTPPKSLIEKLDKTLSIGLFQSSREHVLKLKGQLLGTNTATERPKCGAGGPSK